jgi:hypothetical protein
MDKISEFLRTHVAKVIGVPAVLSTFTFLSNLALALADGTIDDQEFHNLLNSASGIESLYLLIAMFFLRKK